MIKVNTHISWLPPSSSRGYVTQLVFVCETCSENASSRSGAAGDPSSAGGAGGSSRSFSASGESSKEALLEPRMHGLCVSCAHHCHEIIGHNVRNIGEKRHFRCDCGNKQFKQAGRLGNQLLCSLQCEKEPMNQANVYNHNFKDRSVSAASNFVYFVLGDDDQPG